MRRIGSIASIGALALVSQAGAGTLVYNTPFQTLDGTNQPTLANYGTGAANGATPGAAATPGDASTPANYTTNAPNGWAYAFNHTGTSGYLTLGSSSANALPGNTAMSVTSWVYWTGGYDVIAGHLALDSQKSIAGGWDFGTTSDGTLRVQLAFPNGGGAANRQSIAGGLLVNGWNQVTMTYAGPNVSHDLHFYINGQVADNLNNNYADFTPNTATSITIAAGTEDPAYLEGTNYSLADVGLFSSMLSTGEAVSIYSLGKQDGLHYHLAQANQLFNVYEAGAGSQTINGLNWTYASNLNTAGGVGNVQSDNAGGYYLPLDANGGGLVATSVPEPALVSVFTIASVIGLRRRRA